MLPPWPGALRRGLLITWFWIYHGLIDNYLFHSKQTKIRAFLHVCLPLQVSPSQSHQSTIVSCRQVWHGFNRLKYYTFITLGRSERPWLYSKWYCWMCNHNFIPVRYREKKEEYTTFILTKHPYTLMHKASLAIAHWQNVIIINKRLNVYRTPMTTPLEKRTPQLAGTPLKNEKEGSGR